MSIVIYSKPDCIQCNATYRVLNKQGIGYQVVDLTQDDQVLRQVSAMGYQQVPVIVAHDDHWSGFRPDKISALRQLRTTFCGLRDASVSLCLKLFGKYQPFCRQT